jgi:oligoribonuclease
MQRYMPRLAAALHYRIVDVSSVRELAKRWYPRELRRAPRKACEHTAMADIRESIAELRWLRRTIFKPPNK